MKTTLVVSTKNIEHFKNACAAYAIPYTVVKEGIDRDFYEVHLNMNEDLFYMGQMMGIYIGQEIWKQTIKQL